MNHRGTCFRRAWAPTLALASAMAASCDRPPSPDSVPEWSPKDHHSQDDDKLGARAAASAQAGRGPRGGSDDVASLVDLTWQKQCANCHGAGGKGDGPMGPMVKAPDLTQQDWQAGASDADIGSVIRAGKNRMPKYDLPDSVIEGLVARIRLLRGS